MKYFFLKNSIFCSFLYFLLIFCIHLSVFSEDIYSNDFCSIMQDRLICDEVARQLDIVFVFDSTGSMDEELDAVQSTIVDFADALNSSNINFRLGLVDYDGYQTPDEYDVKNNGILISSAYTFRQWIKSIEADGGGEEAVLSALNHAITDCIWREESQKIIILVGDEPPLLTNGKDAGGYTLSATISKLTQNNIITHVIGSLNDLDGPENISMKKIAEDTGGVFFEIQSQESIIPFLNEIKDTLQCTFKIVPSVYCRNDNLIIEAQCDVFYASFRHTLKRNHF